MKYNTIGSLFRIRKELGQQTSNLNSFALVYKNGKVQKFLKQICYGALNYTPKWAGEIKYFPTVV